MTVLAQSVVRSRTLTRLGMDWEDRLKKAEMEE